ncbi:hypothetical protein H6G54_18215 [Anabaena cylindrica FACHB-243]|nr:MULTISPECIES: hypothetical protein [Anabaena]MBD2419602.1 hypothetical protein [Anabaena cylindrica FACHB-243]MBY5282861.1 hypothetical protein [Anabaena sp. CCAP 1446/1C]MBY5306945.1 hypothetical protein [Anabaena sp. CCAP 1446/1C]MCM2407999.1 hypothetical protein [Anabaena sp. CCAP 1446/1C]
MPLEEYAIAALAERKEDRNKFVSIQNRKYRRRYADLRFRRIKAFRVNFDDVEKISLLSLPDFISILNSGS